MSSLRFGLALALLITLLASPASSMPAARLEAAPPPPPGADKIAPWVMANTANGQEAEFLVVLANQADLSGAEALPTKHQKGRYVYETLWNKAQSTQGPLQEWLTARNVAHRSYYIVNLFWVKGDRDVALALAARPDVAHIEGNPKIRNVPEPPSRPAAEAPASPAGVEPNITYVRAPELWALGYTGQGVVVGGQDTGYQWNHPALKTHYRGWTGSSADHDYDWHDSIHSGGGVCGADSPFPCDDNGHGTHTMGTAVGYDGGANQIGMAPGARWIGCRNMDEGFGTPTTYMECFEFFLAPYPVGGTPAQGDPSLAPDVTTNSWGCPPSEGCSANTLMAAVEAQRAAGILTVVAAGNGGPGCSTVSDPPSFYAAVYSVGAISHATGNIASFSSRGPVAADGSNRRKPDITAPGVSIRSSVPYSSYSSSYSGTSMATPHVAGAVALLWSAHPSLANYVTGTEQILNFAAVHVASLLCSSSGWPNNVYGFGRLDVRSAVDMGLLRGTVANAVTSAPVMSATVTSTAIYTATSSAVGVYSTVGTAGTHTLTVSAPGYLTATVGGVTIVAGMTATQIISLTPFIYGALLAPPALSQAGDPGQAVNYALTLTNTGNVTDNYTLTVSSAAFPTTVGRATIGFVSPGESRGVTVTVQIPPNAASGLSSTATIAATSHGSPTQTSASTLTTTANTVRGVSLAPPTAVQSGNPGATVTYTLSLTNTGNLTDTFTVGNSGNTWEVQAPVTSTTLAMGESTTLTLTVTIPLTATIGMSDTVQVTVTGIGASGASTLTTTAALSEHKVYLPFVNRPSGGTAQHNAYGYQPIRFAPRGVRR